MKTLVLFYCFIALSAFCNAQDYTGVWSGYLFVTENDIEKKLPLMMEIESNDKGTYTGRTILTNTFKGDEYHNQSKLTGTLVNTSFSFIDADKIDITNPPDSTFYWCIKSGKLALDTTGYEPKMLIGNITGTSNKGACAAGRVELSYRSSSH